MGLDLCNLQGCTLLVCYSEYIKVGRLTTITSTMVIKLLNERFARHGTPEKMVLYNDRQFDSWEFEQFAEKLGIEHITSSPRYPQSNGRAKNVEKCLKKIKKTLQEGKGSRAHRISSSS